MAKRSKAKRAKGRVGVIGLGIMGGAFARHLVADGFQVLGRDTDPARRRALARAGVAICAQVKDVLAAPFVITCLPNAAALHAVAAEIAAAKAAPRIVIEASTFSLDDKQAAAKVLRKAGHVMLDCPVSGTGAQAANKDLVVYASGDSATIRKARPVFAGFARQVEDLGTFGNGSRMKYVANLLVAIHNVAAAEAMVLGMKAGLDPEQIFKLATAGAGNSRIFEVRGPMMVEGKYAPATVKSSVWQKDLTVIGDFAASLDAPTPLFSATLPVYASAMAIGYAEEDTGAVCAALEHMAGLKRRKKR
jgi:3-hydroxyisobutyrate dehydrogenase-like beta-hydroxyacid dehydrogenase